MLGAEVATERLRPLAATGAALLIESTAIALIEIVESAATDGRCATDMEPADTSAVARFADFLLVAILAESGGAFRRPTAPVAAPPACALGAAGFTSADAAAVRPPVTASPNVAAGWAMFA